MEDKDLDIQPVPRRMKADDDILGRQEFVDRLKSLCDIVSDNRSNVCFAVNGKWGTGKTFVLDMFEEQLKDVYQDGTNLTRYLVFRYNCWEYDYYEEPLVAIIASIAEQLEAEVHLLSGEAKAKIDGVVSAITKVLAESAFDFVEQRYGISARKIGEAIQNGVVKEQDHSYDDMFSFRKQLRKLQAEMRTLSKDQTILVIVDELDRCLPTYTIKVLERLHHLFTGIDNTQVIIAVDKDQLAHSIRQIYGEGTDVDGYLQKFVSFEVALDVGTFSDEQRFNDKFQRYIDKFKLDEGLFVNDVNQFKMYILDGIDMRKRIAFIEKCEILRKLLDSEYACEGTYLCLELFLTILDSCDIDLQSAKNNFYIGKLFDPPYIWGSNEQMKHGMPEGLRELSDKIKDEQNDGDRKLLANSGHNDQDWVNTSSLNGLLLMVYRRILGFDNDILYGNTEETRAFREYGVKYWNLLQIIH